MPAAHFDTACQLCYIFIFTKETEEKHTAGNIRFAVVIWNLLTLILSCSASVMIMM